MTHPRRFFTTLAVGLVVWLGVFLVGVLPWFARVDARRIALQNLRREAAFISEKLRTGVALAGAGAQFEEDRRRFAETFITGEKSTLDFIREVETLAGTHRLALDLSVADSARAAQRTSGSGDTLPFQLELIGAFPDIVRFFATLEQDTWWLTVDDVRFDATGAAGAGTAGGIPIRATATLRVFTQSP